MIGWAAFEAPHQLPTGVAIGSLKFTSPMSLSDFDVTHSDTLVESKNSYDALDVMLVHAGSLFSDSSAPSAPATPPPVSSPSSPKLPAPTKY